MIRCQYGTVTYSFCYIEIVMRSKSLTASSYSECLPTLHSVRESRPNTRLGLQELDTHVPSPSINRRSHSQNALLLHRNSEGKPFLDPIVKFGDALFQELNVEVSPILGSNLGFGFGKDKLPQVCKSVNAPYFFHAINQRSYLAALTSGHASRELSAPIQDSAGTEIQQQVPQCLESLCQRPNS